MVTSPAIGCCLNRSGDTVQAATCVSIVQLPKLASSPKLHELSQDARRQNEGNKKAMNVEQLPSAVALWHALIVKLFSP